MVSGLQSHNYKERQEELGLTTQVERRHQKDMLLVLYRYTKSLWARTTCKAKVI
jgi:hypothetical protein